MRPGRAPTYVRRWPRMSASSSNAAQRHARELAAERAGDRLAERGLADTGRPDERDDRARTAAAEHLKTTLLAELAHREELDDARTSRRRDRCGPRRGSRRAVGEVVVVLGAHVPGDVEHPVEVRADPAVLGVLLAGALQAARARAPPLCAPSRASPLPRSACGSRRRRRRRPRRAPCGSPRAAGAAGTPAGSSPFPRRPRCGSSPSARPRRGSRASSR